MAGNWQRRETLDHFVILKAIDFGYDKAVNGLPGFKSAEEMVEVYLRKEVPLIDRVNAQIRRQNVKAGTSGSLTGICGVVLMPLSVPVGVSSVMYFQVRMIAAIAHMGGHDIRDERVEALACTCLCGNMAKDVFSEFGIKIAVNLTEQVLRKMSSTSVEKLNQAVGFRLWQKWAKRGQGIWGNWFRWSAEDWVF